MTPPNQDETTDREGAGRKQKYSDEELLDWIHSFVEVLGRLPTAEEVNDSPGPAHRTFAERFGSWRNAVEKAGYEPRDRGPSLGRRATEEP